MRLPPTHGWVYVPATDSYCFFKFPEGEGAFIADEPIVALSRRQYEMLKNWMVDNNPHGVIRTDRKEDLKIIHKTLDIIQSLSESAKKETKE